ncbi:KR domain-containing protein [Xylaria palmicola]|nr:KR domain-containing protein [Xylaria palmicola]
MSHEDWEASTNPKTRGSWNLHTVLPKGLDFFVLLSSITGIVGSAGQANYAAGNTYMDALAHYRNALGERAVALDLGAILDHGVIAANELITILGKIHRPKSWVEETRFTRSRHSGLCIKQALRDRIPSTGLLRGVYSSELLARRRGLGVSRERRQPRSPAETSLRVVSPALLRRLAGMTSELRNRIPAEDEDKYLDEPLQNFGVDSLQAIGLRSWFAHEFAADVPVFVILGDETLASLGLWVAGRSTLR